MVDPSLLRQANDRGVTIAFADLDGADGLWVPEERTILVSRKLTEADVARVIEHEMTHVMIDDQHADLDAGKDVLVGHPPARSRRWLAAALTAAGLLAVVGGATYGIAKATGGPPKEQQFAPTLPGLTASESGSPPPGMVVVPSRGPDGRIVYVTVAAGSRPATPTVTPTPSPTVTLSPTASVTAVPPPRPSATKGPVVTVSPTPAPPVTTTTPPVVTTTEPTPTQEPPPSSDPPVGGTVPPVDGQGDAGPGGTVDLPGSGSASDAAVAGSGDADPGVDPTG